MNPLPAKQRKVVKIGHNVLSLDWTLRSDRPTSNGCSTKCQGKCNTAAYEIIEKIHGEIPKVTHH